MAIFSIKYYKKFIEILCSCALIIASSILAITNQEAQVVEKRWFDAWGNIVSVQDGQGNTLDKLTILDRGYTGHEHLQSVGLIHMNGRLYDPLLHRFLAPDNYVQDPFNTQSFNRYGYVLNNPLMYSDPDGELPFLVIAVGAIIGAAVGGASYIGHAILTGNWNWGQFGMSLLSGAILGAATAGTLPASITSNYVTSMVLGGFASGFLPSFTVPVGDWSFSISPSVAFGNAAGIGANLSVSYSDGNFSLSGGYGISYYGRAYGTGASGWESRKSWGVNWDDGRTGFGVYSTRFSSGETSQKVGGLSFRSGDFGLRYENDFIEKPLVGVGKILADGEDRWRTTALQLSYKDYSLGLKFFTGEPTDNLKEDYGGRYGTYSHPNANKYRLGAAYFGYKGYQAGYNSEAIRGFIQNRLIHDKFTDGSSWFKQLPYFPSQTYIQYQSYNPFTLW